MFLINLLRILFLITSPVEGEVAEIEQTGFRVQVYPYGGYYSYPPYCPPGYSYGPYSRYYGHGCYYYGRYYGRHYGRRYAPYYYYGPRRRYYRRDRYYRHHRGKKHHSKKHR